MPEPFNMKKTVLEPKVYALILKSKCGQSLHVGVHFTLEEAYGAARRRIEKLPGYKDGDAVDIDLWNTMPGRQAIVELMDPTHLSAVHLEVNANQEIPFDLKGNPQEALADMPEAVRNLLEGVMAGPETFMETIMAGAEEDTIEDCVNDMKLVKNDLMKKLIAEANIEQADKLKGLLGSNSYRYVMSEIKKKKVLPLLSHEKQETGQIGNKDDKPKKLKTK